MRNGMYRSVLVSMAVAILLSIPVLAEASDSETLLGSPSNTRLESDQVQLSGSRDRFQLLVTGEYAAQELRDLTRISKFESADPKVATVNEAGVVQPVGNGSTEVIARVGDAELRAKVVVAGLEKPQNVEFENHVIAVLSKAGCSAGACHGSPSGKNGFRLSLRGYDPPLDFESLTRDIYGRRTNRNQPDDSLMLQKPTGVSPHEGGVRLEKDSPLYGLLRDWIAEGLRGDGEKTPKLKKLDVIPHQRVLHEPADAQQLQVLAHFHDGTVRDVSELAVFSSSNEEAAKVGKTGLVTGTRTGESAILVRYLDQMDTAYVTFLKDAPGFSWQDPPTNNYVDELAFAKMKMLQMVPSGISGDAEFVRRSSLDLRGTLPTIDEVRAFLNDKSADKRSRWIDKLLESEEYLSFWTLKLSDVLRSNRKAVQLKGVHVFQRWIRESLRSDKPFDQFVRELLVAQGNAFKNPQANYYRVARDPQNCVETTAQLFLGIRMQCAKCHNHPFERWSQDDYYGLAAFFTRVKYKSGAEAGEEVVFLSRSGEITQPRTGQQMKPTFLGGVPAELNDPDRRVALAEWITSPENPFFTRASVNRIWFHLMGRGIIDPPDDVRDSNPPSNGSLLDALARDFIDHKYSVRHIIRTIMNSRVYQLSAETNDWNKDDEAYFTHAVTRLLSAEQLLDAICQATSLPEKFPGLPVGTRATMLPDPVNHEFLQTFGQPNRELACECERESDSSLSQALQMINGPFVAGKLRDANNRIGQLIKAGKNDDQIVEELFLATLSRFPAESELATIKTHMEASKDRRLGLEDVHWALINSKEFLFRH